MASTSLCKAVANELLPLTAVVLYDDYESGCRAKALLEQVAANIGGETPFSLALWRMDSLAYPGTSAEVMRDLGRSMLLVLAFHHGGELPKSVFEWVECWAQFGAGDDWALVVLGSAPTAVVGELEQIAQRRGITLFCEPTTQPGWGWQNRLEDLQQRAQTPLWPILEELDWRPGSYRHWGINE